MAEHNKTVRNRKAQSMLAMHKEKKLSQRNALRIKNQSKSPNKVSGEDLQHLHSTFNKPGQRQSRM